jgi:translation initiation factor IF-2
MVEEQTIRLSQAARRLNVGTQTLTEHLATKGFKIENKPNTKITLEQFGMLSKEFASSALDKEEALGLTIGKKHAGSVFIDSDKEEEKHRKEEEEEFFIKSLSSEKEVKPAEPPAKPVEREKLAEELKKEDTFGPTAKLQGIKVVGKIDLSEKVQKKKEEEPKKKEPPVQEKPEKPEKPLIPVEQIKVEEQEKQEIIKEEVEEEKAPPPTRVEVKEEKEEPAAKRETVEIVPEEPDIEEPVAPEKAEKIEARADQLKGLTVVGKIDLPEERIKSKKPVKPVASSDDQKEKKKKRPRKRILQKQNGNKEEKPKVAATAPTTADAAKKKEKPSKFRKKVKFQKEEVSDKQIQEQIKQTLAKLSGGKKVGVGGSRSKYKREKRSAMADALEERLMKEQEDSKILHVNEFISANDLSSLMDVSVNEVISTCMNLGLFVSINQRLDAESITVIADEFGYGVEFISSDDELLVEVEEDQEENLKERAPIVTIMGHVDHGKTSLLDYIRHAKVAAGEAGGITQHIGAYEVTTESKKRIVFLDTPGHEAFTAMRARGASITDVVVIVVAADDNVMPQTKEAINHAQVAGVPIIIAINKMDKPQANPEKIREELANMNILVEDWGGKYQCQEISAKTGQGVNELLEKVLLESEMLELKANPNRNANGAVIEASLDRGRGYLATVLIQNGAIKVGDVILAGAHYGKVKAMFNHRGEKIDSAGPSTPVLLLGLDGAPQAGDKINVMDSEREAREIANKRAQLHREQNIRTKKHITLDEIGRRLAIGSFKELNVIVKGDVDGSVEALKDSLLKLSTQEVQVSIIHSAVGQISESDVLLASASDAIIIGFQVRPSASARKLAELEEIEIRLYSVIYDAINEVRDAMEGLLAPSVEETITGNVEVREVFKVSKVGTVAGCMVTEGVIKRNNRIRVVRDGIVIHTGEINQLKRFKDDVTEVKSGYECGLSIKSYHDLKEGDNIEAFVEKEVKRKL